MRNKSGDKKTRFMQWQRDIIRFFLPYAKPERKYLIFLGGLSIMMTGANAYLIWKLGEAISQINTGKFDALDQTLITIGIIVLFNQIVKYIYAYNFQQVTLRFVDRVRGKLLEHVMLISFPVYSRFDKGDLVTRINNDVDRLLTYVINIPLNLFANIIILTIYTSLVFWIDWRMSLIALALSPLFFLSQQYIAPKTGSANRHFIQEKAALVSIEQQTLDNLRGITSFNGQSVIQGKHKNQFHIARSWALKVRKIRILFNSFSTFLLYFAGVIIVYSGISSVESGRLTIGVLVSFLIYIRTLTMPVRSIGRIPIQFHANRAAAERVMEIFHMQPIVLEQKDAKPLQVKQGTIKLNNVSFSYPDMKTSVFQNVSLEIHAGETIALVGKSGAGKSTLAGLLLRFYDPQQGTIYIDGIDIKTVTLQSLRQQISVVWQESYLISGTIKENLLLAKPDASDDQIVAACHLSYAWEFIEKLENGLNTVFGKNGISLSAGQMQRLVIAQAFLRDSPILIFDEASSSLDSHSEKMVIEALQSLRKHRTTLVIAHRFSSIRNADRILYLKNDGSIKFNTHHELMKSTPEYKQAVDWQTSQI